MKGCGLFTPDTPLPINCLSKANSSWPSLFGFNFPSLYCISDASSIHTGPNYLLATRCHLTVIKLSSPDHLTVTLHSQTGIYQISSESNHDPALSGHSTSQQAVRGFSGPQGISLTIEPGSLSAFSAPPAAARPPCSEPSPGWICRTAARSGKGGAISPGCRPSSATLASCFSPTPSSPT